MKGKHGLRQGTETSSKDCARLHKKCKASSVPHQGEWFAFVDVILKEYWETIYWLLIAYCQTKEHLIKSELAKLLLL
jgi:hypothetical protein